MIKVTSEPISTSTFMKRPKASSTKAPSNMGVGVVLTPSRMARIARPRMPTASSVIGPSELAATQSAEKDEEDSADREDQFRQAMRESGGKRHHCLRAFKLGERHGMGRSERLVIAVDQAADRRGPTVEDRPWMNAIIDRQQHERNEDRNLATRKIEHPLKACLFQNTENDPAVKVKRISGGQDDPRRGETATRLLARKVPSIVRNSPTKPEVPGRPTLAMVKSMKTTA